MKRARWLILVSIVWALGGVTPAVSQATSSTPTGEILEVTHLAVARGEDGVIWAVWQVDTRGDTDLYFSRWQAGAWSPARALHSRPEAWDRTPGIAITPDGIVWVVWSATERADPGDASLYASRWMGGGWTEPARIPTGRLTRATQPVLAAAPDGSLWLAWAGLDGLDQEIFAARWTGDRWSTPVQVSTGDGDAALYDAQPRLAVGRDGHPWLVWTGHQAGVDDEIYYSRWNGSGWSAEGLVSQDDDSLDVDPSLALDAGGRPWVAWKGRVKQADGSHSRARIWVSRWDDDAAGWLPEEMASSPLSTGLEEEQPILFRARDREMHLAWVAEGLAGTALAISHWQGGAWQGASLLRESLDAGAVFAAVQSRTGAHLLWLSPAEGSLQPPVEAVVSDAAVSLSTWAADQPGRPRVQDVDPIPNRTLAFGDSITCTPTCLEELLAAGAAQDEPYPAKLEAVLDVRVAESEVINAGKSGEATFGGSERITGQVSTHRPTYVLILEGTNDVTRDKLPADVLVNLQNMIDNARQVAGVTGVEVMLATIIPRTDGKNLETEQMNALAVVPAAQSRGVPVCDQWGAMMRLPYWQYLLEPDGKHPNDLGRQQIADTFYACMIALFPGVGEETVPPDAWIVSLPPGVECGEPAILPVTWSGADDLSWVVDYDLQARVNDGPWADWLIGTQATAGTYGGPSETRYGDRFHFQVRARDLVGNVGPYSDPVYSEVIDSVPPTEAHVNPLPPAVAAPFQLSWWGADDCSGVTAYGVQYRSDTDIEWQTWLSPTLSQGGSFSPPVPRYGETYQFRVRPRDAAGNWGAWSAVEASTILARWTLAGQVLNTRHEPVTGASVSLDPSALHVAHRPGGRFLAYLDEGGSYDVSVARPDRYGPLPAMAGVAVSADVSGLSFILPPLDDAVAGGGFEAGTLTTWQVGGTLTPTLSAVAHTGLGAVRLGGAGQSAHLSQWVTPGEGERPTLSFLVRLDEPGTTSALQVELANNGSLSSPVVYTVPVDGEGWTHTWYDLAGLVSEPLTITFRVSDTAAVLLDEISLGSSAPGLYPIYLPVLVRH